MDWMFALLGMLLLTLVIVAPIVALVLAVMAFRRVADLQGRIGALESAAMGSAPARAKAAAADEPEIVMAEAVPEIAVPVQAGSAARSDAAPSAPIDWEQLIGRRALGWVAVVLLLFAAAFFLRFAYENRWIGPQGQVGIGILAGLGLMLAGWRYHIGRWRLFSQMLSSAGIVVLYLSVYSSFGFYRLVPQHIASAFMLAVILQSALVAVLYRSAALAWMSVLGGLLTPVLMASEVDRYPEFFTYLVLLNVGVIVLGRLRSWAGLGSAALIGTHVLFWMWYDRWYHPEKFAWALGFQLALFLVFLGLDVSRRLVSARRAGWEDLVRLLVNAYLWFAAAYILLRPDYGDWLGLLAVAMAGVYVAVARLALVGRIRDDRQLLTALAASVGFVAFAFPIQADARWVAFGWAAVAAALWWFGLRVRGPALRVMAGALIALAVGRLLFFDILERGWQPEWPILNPDALPALGVVACLLGAMAVAGRYRSALAPAETVLVAIATVAGILLLWVVLTVDVGGYFRFLARQHPEQAVAWRWMGQLAVSALWAVYAVVVLAIGFARRLALLRWTALLIFAWTTGKVLLLDIAGLREFYRILAFFVVAVLLGLAAWAYQRIRVDHRPDRRAIEADGAADGG